LFLVCTNAKRRNAFDVDAAVPAQNTKPRKGIQFECLVRMNIETGSELKNNVPVNSQYRTINE
jgi:hypothetical protein